MTITRKTAVDPASDTELELMTAVSDWAREILRQPASKSKADVHAAWMSHLKQTDFMGSPETWLAYRVLQSSEPWVWESSEIDGALYVPFARFLDHFVSGMFRYPVQERLQRFDAMRRILSRNPVLSVKLDRLQSLVSIDVEGMGQLSPDARWLAESIIGTLTAIPSQRAQRWQTIFARVQTHADEDGSPDTPGQQAGTPTQDLSSSRSGTSFAKKPSAANDRWKKAVDEVKRILPAIFPLESPWCDQFESVLISGSRRRARKNRIEGRFRRRIFLLEASKAFHRLHGKTVLFIMIVVSAVIGFINTLENRQISGPSYRRPVAVDLNAHLHVNLDEAALIRTWEKVFDQGGEYALGQLEGLYGLQIVLFRDDSSNMKDLLTRFQKWRAANREAFNAGKIRPIASEAATPDGARSTQDSAGPTEGSP